MAINVASLETAIQAAVKAAFQTEYAAPPPDDMDGIADAFGDAVKAIAQSVVTAVETPPSVTGLTLLNGWKDMVSYVPPGYYLDHFGRVHLRGTLDGAAAVSNTVAQLPAGHRPAAKISFAVWGKLSAQAVNISASGIITTAVVDYVSLDGISFMAGT